MDVKSIKFNNGSIEEFSKEAFLSWCIDKRFNTDLDDSNEDIVARYVMFRLIPEWIANEANTSKCTLEEARDKVLEENGNYFPLTFKCNHWTGRGYDFVMSFENTLAFAGYGEYDNVYGRDDYYEFLNMIIIGF